MAILATGHAHTKLTFFVFFAFLLSSLFSSLFDLQGSSSSLGATWHLHGAV
jgi:hypothetical protein